MKRHPFPALLPLLALLIAGCGSHAAATPRPTIEKLKTPRLPSPTVVSNVVIPTPTPAAPTTPTPSPTVPVATAATAATAVPTATSLPPTAAPRPSPVPRPARLLAASLRPNAVSAGGALTATVDTAGSVSAVEVYLGSGDPSGPAPMTLSLSEGSPGVWTATGTAPTIGGQYHFTVGLYNAGGQRTVIDNDGWNVQVAGQPTAVPSGAQPLPADIPLAPPFSYGDPVSAIFTAGGQTVNGSEVSSVSQSAVSADVVAQFYETHLSRAGWSVDQSSFPAAGASSFSIDATMAGAGGTRVCIVQYSGSAVHIFYGSLGT